MDVKEAGSRGGLAKWAKVKSRRKRSEIMRKVRRGEKHRKPIIERATPGSWRARKVNPRNGP